MELVMQELEDSTPWQKDQQALLDASALQNTMDEQPAVPVAPPLEGRGYFSNLGIVRRKPCAFSSPSLSTNEATTNEDSSPRRPSHALQIMYRQALPR
jgi:hypothetical protein